MNDNKKVTLPELVSRVCDKCDYKPEIVRKVINVFLDELKDAILNNYQVQIKNLFSFRHKWRNETRSGNFGDPKSIPAHMTVVANFSRNLTKPLQTIYKDNNKEIPKSLRDLPLGDFK